MHRNRVALLAVLALSAAITDAQVPRPSQLTAPRSEPRSTILDDPTAYGLAAKQGIANAQIVLTKKRDTRDPKDIVGPAGEIVAKAVSGAGGGVTFENVPPGQYVVTITVVHVVSQPVASMTAELPLPSDLFPSRRMKSFFEIRSSMVPMTPTISGRGWRSFANMPYVYAVRGVSLPNEAVEVRTGQHSTVIAQQFVVPDGNPATVQAAIGHENSC
ncbi:MAG TPA: hypothetical protein VEK57_27560 [Thermoanaerobaculia bacterium]|nr:hypothetical protein [Thermoanaerobaculia bacterium]